MSGSPMCKSDGLDVWYVVPTCRPENVENIFANFECQSIKGSLLIVENGDAVGACEKAGLIPNVLLQSEPNVGSARSAALRYLRSVAPDAYIVWMDDDDTYHRTYATKAIEHNDGKSVTMASGHFINMEGHYFWGSTNVRLEGTMSGPQSVFREADGVPVGEGEKMASEVRRTDLPVCVNRTAGTHTWTNVHEKYLTFCQPFIYLGQQVPNIGQLNPTGQPLLKYEFMLKYKDVVQVWRKKREEAQAAG